MEKRNNLLTFIAALIPGVGYMYLGLVKKGVQMLILFLAIQPICRLLGISFIGEIIRVPLWFYTFFDTFNTASKIDRGEVVNDSDFVFKKYGETGFNGKGFISNSRSIWIILAWVLIAAGVLAIVNTSFSGNELYGLIKSFISTYFFPVLLVAAGIYMLFRNKH